jgi:hypothetical protein
MALMTGARFLHLKLPIFGSLRISNLMKKSSNVLISAECCLADVDASVCSFLDGGNVTPNLFDQFGR